MKLSVITPSFNQAQFLPANLESVKTQTHNSVEHIVVDPGSTDGSIAIAKKNPHVILINEPDRGQSDGICKGFSRSSGDILVWLNSDDFYPDQFVLESVARCFHDNPEVDIIYGDVNFVDEKGEFLRKGFINKKSDQLLDSFQHQVGIVQPGVFWRRRVFEEIGGPSEEFEYCMDYELWVRMASKGYNWMFLPKVLAHHRWWDGMKTSSRRDLSLREHFKVCDRYFGYVHWKWLDRYADYLCSNQDGIVNHASYIDSTTKTSAIRQAIDEVVTQEMLALLALAEDKELVETRKYIDNHYPEKKRVYFIQSELNIISESAADPKAQERVAWNIFDAVSIKQEHFVAYHVPDNFDRYFTKDWHTAQLERSRVALLRLKSERRGDVCVVVGNGPSLRKSDLSLLANVDTIMSNFAVLSKDLRRYAKYLTVVNDLVAKQGAIDFNVSRFVMIVPFWLANYFNSGENTFFVNATVKPEFGFNFVSDSSWRSTVSFFNLQLAYALGYKKVILIGFDHSYIQPKGVVEGVVINQKDDDDNHFDPRYFKGKDWQAADTTNMEKMYLVAKAAYEKAGREIVNCTVGGKLEVFRRGDLERELMIAGAFLMHQPENEIVSYPKLLMIDSTPVGHISATGQLKQTFLGNWPQSNFLQIWETGGQASSLRSIRLDQTIESSRQLVLSLDDVVKKSRAFDPDVIYFRPIDSDVLLEAADRIVSELGKPLVIHMMDDWPERLRLTDIAKFHRIERLLRSQINRACRRLSICQAMSDVYQSRYGGEWLPLANGVDLSEFPGKDWSKRPPVTQAAPFVIRYMGALADDMTYASVRDIADAVSDLQKVCAVRLKIHTMDWCLAKAERDLGNLAGVSVGPLVDEWNYRPTLSEADALVIAYNFDPKSIAYIGLSLANKMPECLASGVPLLAYGPLDVATIRYLKDAECTQVVEQKDPAQLRAAIFKLVNDPKKCRYLGDRARKYVAANLTKQSIQKKFREHLSDLQQMETTMKHYVVGPYERQQKAHYDETDCIAELFGNGILTGKVMIDVGAHHGWAHAPFLDKGWRIFAFEPDDKNRAKLLERLAKHKNKALVSLDTRCVSNKSQKSVSFFTSEQSTGISGLSAFLESHVEAQRVDITTLTEFFQDKPLPELDFLKIDTEGHDLFVLQGFPWDRVKPVVIECEFEDTKTVPLGYTFHDLARFLVDKGYKVYVSEWHPIIRYGIRHDWNRLELYPCELADSKGWGNLLAFRDPIDEQALGAAVMRVLKVGAGETVKTVGSAIQSIPSVSINKIFSGFNIEAGPNFTATGTNQWRYTHSDAKQKLWIATRGVSGSTSGREYMGSLRVQAERAMTVNVSIGRFGKTDYEGTMVQANLHPGVAKTILLNKSFTHDHASLKLQLEVLELAGEGSVLMSIDALYLDDLVASISRRVAKPNATLTEANRLFREGDYGAAMGMYLVLYRQRPLQMYLDNALMAARKLGLASSTFFNEILNN